MLKIGLTGGIGAGKSAVAARLAERGAVIVDADRLAREVVEPGTDGLREVEAAFGPGVLRPDGALDRAALGRRVFGDEAARRRLECIIHPRVRARTAELASRAAPDAIVVNDVPLLVETGLAPSYHLVIVVDAPAALRVDRLVRTRGMAEAEAYARIRAQATDEQRRAVADALLHNEGSLAELRAEVDSLWDGRLRPYEENLRLGRPARPPVDPTAFARHAARLRLAAGDLDVRVDRATDGLEIRVQPPDAEPLGRAIAAAGYPPDPSDGRHGSADPGQPAWVYLRS